MIPANAGLRSIGLPPLFLAALAVATAALLGLAPGASGAQQGRYLEQGADGTGRAAGELVVTYKPGASEARIEASNQERGASTLRTIPRIGARVLSFPGVKGLASQERLRAMENIKQVYEQDPLVDLVDYNYGRRMSQESAGNFGDSWGVGKVEAPQAWSATTGEGATVAIVDTGVDASHPDLAGKVVAQRDFVDGDAIAEDAFGHGTHVAGIVAASSNGDSGLGVCPDCGIIDARVAGDDGLAFDSTAAEGIIWSADSGADVINVSLASPGYSRVLERAVEYAWNSGSVVVAAAGNDGAKMPVYPAAYGTAISVSATDQDDRLASFSNYGDWVDVAAPGSGILSTVPGGYAVINGTSQACAYVSGLAGLLASQGMAAADIRHRMEFTADELGAPGKDPYYGWGRIDARSATGAVAPQPEISAVEAPAGAPGEIATFTLTGSGFQDGARVLLFQGRDSVEANYVNVESPERAVASVPIPESAADATLDAVLINPDGQRNGYLGAVRIGGALETSPRRASQSQYAPSTGAGARPATEEAGSR